MSMFLSAGAVLMGLVAQPESGKKKKGGKKK